MAGIYSDYCDDTSIHGWQYTTRGKYNKCIRIYWVCTIIFSIIMAIFFLAYNGKDFYDDTTTVTLDTHTNALSDVYFPAITLCNINQLRYSFMLEIGLGGDGKEDDMKRQTLTEQLMSGAYDDVDKSKEINNYLSTEAAQKGFCRYWQTRGFGANKESKMVNGKCTHKVEDGKPLAPDFETVFDNTGNQFEEGDMVLSATYQDDETGENENTHLYPSVGTDGGMCLTIKPQVDFNHEYDKLNASERASKIKTGEAISGKRNGISLLIDAESYNHFFTADVRAGLSLLIHRHDDHPLVTMASIDISDGQMIQASVTPVITSTTDTAKNRFAYGDRGCYYQDEIELSFLPYSEGYRYSMSNCMFQASMESILADCQCFPNFHAPIIIPMTASLESKYGIKNLMKCTGKKLSCAFEKLHKISSFTKTSSMSDGESCLPACEDQLNSVAISTSRFPAEGSFFFTRDFCLLLVKLMDQCLDPYKKQALGAYFSTTTSDCSTNIEIQICDLLEKIRKYFNKDTKAYLSKGRGEIAKRFCVEEERSWMKLLGVNECGLKELRNLLYTYAQKNLLRMNVYLSEPYVTKFTRDETQSPIGFVANCGGLMGLCMGFSLVSIAEIIYYCILRRFVKEKDENETEIEHVNSEGKGS